MGLSLRGLLAGLPTPATWTGQGQADTLTSKQTSSDPTAEHDGTPEITGYCCLCSPETALADVAQWIGCQPVNQRIR